MTRTIRLAVTSKPRRFAPNADALPGTGQNIIYLGDFNMYYAAEPAYQTLLSAGDGQAFDPINQSGTWTAHSSFKRVHTQSPFQLVDGRLAEHRIFGHGRRHG